MRGGELVLRVSCGGYRKTGMLMEALKREGLPSALYTAAQRGHCFLHLHQCPSRRSSSLQRSRDKSRNNLNLRLPAPALPSPPQCPLPATTGPLPGELQLHNSESTRGPLPPGHPVTRRSI